MQRTDLLSAGRIRNHIPVRHLRMDEAAYDPVIKMDRGSIHFTVAYALETLISEWWNEIGRHGCSIASWTAGDIFGNTWRSGSASERGK